MPGKPPAACKRPGCAGLVRNGVCSVCGPVRRQSAAEHDARRGNFRQRGYDTRWDKVRAMHLQKEPLCRMCQIAGRVTQATMVDHIVPIRDGGALLDDDNLQSLCIACHGVKTAEDMRNRRGG